jgi:hypothetical protein
MIYGRFGNEVRVQRYAVLADVQRIDGRKPDKQDREAIKTGSYVIVTDADSGKERLYHQAFLRADRGSIEIKEALDSTPAGEP